MLPFKLPPPNGESENPRWNGSCWDLGNKKVDVLEYSTNYSGWSDDLTKLHEDSIGQNHPIDNASRQDAIAQIQHAITANANPIILEIGCSSGFLIRDLNKSFPEAHVIGSDVVKEPLNILAANIKIPFIRFDLLKCPLPDNCIDVVVMLNVLEHIEDDVTALQKVFNILKTNGTLVLEVPAGPKLYDSYDAQLNHFRRYSSFELQKKLEKVGFTIKRNSHLGFFLFPAFVFIKLMGKFANSKNNMAVEDRASKTSKSLLVLLSLKVEQAYFRKFTLPFGIRALITAKK